MSRGGSRDNAVAHSHLENIFDARHMQIAGVGPKAVTGNPKIDVRRLNFRDLRKVAGRPMFSNSRKDERLPLNRFWLLMLDRCRIAVAELADCKLSLRGIDLRLVVF